MPNFTAGARGSTLDPVLGAEKYVAAGRRFARSPYCTTCTERIEQLDDAVYFPRDARLTHKGDCAVAPLFAHVHAMRARRIA